MRLAGDRLCRQCGASAENGHARDHECDQPLKHYHCRMRSLDEKNGLVQGAFYCRLS
jgi:hypothetical protein